MSNKKRKHRKKRHKMKTPVKTLLNIKITRKDRKLLNKLAKKFAGGNLSAWLRHAGKQYRPRVSEVIR